MQGCDYAADLILGSVEDLRGEGGGKVFRLLPSKGSIEIKLSK